MAYINMWLFHIICTPYAVSGFTQSLSQHSGDTLHNPQHPGFNPTDPHLPPAAEFGVEFGVIGVDTERAKVVKLRP